jgi:hypothetical protein
VALQIDIRHPHASLLFHPSHDLSLQYFSVYITI